MTNRANFSLETKRTLAGRVAYHCSFPGCWAVTIGPSDEAQQGPSNIGMACHIVAASGGPSTRRVVPEMSEEDRKSLDNGIWLCYTHGKLVDTDEERFTISMLKTWRRLAEARARIELELGPPVNPGNLLWVFQNLVEHSITLTEIGKENDLIGNALRDCCISFLWGKELGGAVRDLTIELARNAFKHGRATEFSLQFQGRLLRLVDNGNTFDSTALLDLPAVSGGAIALQYLLHTHGNELLVTSRRVSGLNETVITFPSAADDVLQATPCAFKWEDTVLDHINYELSGVDFDTIEKCETVYMIVPDYFSVSDVLMVVNLLLDRIGHKKVVFVGHDVSKGVRELLLKSILGSRFMCLT